MNLQSTIISKTKTIFFSILLWITFQVCYAGKTSATDRSTFFNINTKAFAFCSKGLNIDIKFSNENNPSDTLVLLSKDSSCYFQLGYFLNGDEFYFLYQVHITCKYEFTDFHLMLMDRWGTILNETNESPQLWNTDGSKFADSVYWIVDYTDKKKKKVSVHGLLHKPN